MSYQSNEDFEWLQWQLEGQVVTCGSDRFGYQSEAPTTLSLDSINLLEWLTELSKPVYSLHSWFITKDTKGYKSPAR